MTPSPYAQDPGPLPEETLRSFAPVAVGDLQTSASYLNNGLIRIRSATQAGERFTPFEERTMASSIKDIATTFGLVKAALDALAEAQDVS